MTKPHNTTNNYSLLPDTVVCLQQSTKQVLAATVVRRNHRHCSYRMNRPKNYTSLGRHDPLQISTSVISQHSIDSISKELKNINKEDSSHNTSIDKNVILEYQ
jgi:hypothetical protein